MGNYLAIKDVGSILVGLLEAIAWADISLGVADTPKISLKSPKEIEKSLEKGVITNDYNISLFLYQIHENGYLKNQEMEKVTPARLRYPPISLDLFYLVTPYAGKDPTPDASDSNRSKEQEMMGKIIQQFHDHAIVKGSLLKGSLQGTAEELRLILNSVSLDDLSKLWTTFPETPFRLSVSYKVTPVLIDSTRDAEIRRIEKKETGYYRVEEKK